MRVLMLAPLWHPIGQDAPGGIETFLFHLVSALERAGCSVTLLASGDSRTPAELVPVVERNLYRLMSDREAGEYSYYEQQQLALALAMATAMAPRFDVVHSHVGPGAFVLSALPEIGPRTLHTIHTPVYGDLEWFVHRHPGLALSTVSEFQARRLRDAGATRCWTVHNGIDFSGFSFNDKPERRLLYMGRIEEAKGPHLAVATAQTLGWPLTLAGPIVDARYFERSVKPHLGGEVQYVGVVDHVTKVALMGDAACMLLPFTGPEPFGMVSIEAMACGTPVVALSSGALPEIVESGVTGYLATGPDALASLALEAIELDRSAVRARAEARFGIERTAHGYLEIYDRIASGTRRARPGAG
jgi:glycosyltransferase involved in cell wall biosynthesis